MLLTVKGNILAGKIRRLYYHDSQGEHYSPKIGIDWNQGSNADFEIQLSSGGGQFLTVYHGTIHAEKGMEKKTYTFPGMVSSDIRVLITKGKAEVCELHVDGFMGNN